ncbi:uncharacterized protein WM294_008415 isoform 1-T2 [Sarcoramphus papa]
MCLFYCFPPVEFASMSQIMWFRNLKATYLCGGENEWFSLCNLALPSLLPFPHIPMCYGASCSRNSLGMKCHRLKLLDPSASSNRTRLYLSDNTSTVTLLIKSPRTAVRLLQ